MVTRALVALALALALSACAPIARTEVLLVVDTNIRGPDGIDTIEVSITPPDGEVRRSTATLRAGDPELPRTLGLVLDDERARLGPYTVFVSGMRRGAPLLVRTLRFSFQRGRTLMLRVDLLESCRGIACGAEQTCEAGACRSIDIAPEELVEWRGRPTSVLDSGPPGIDASEPRDASTPEDARPLEDAASPPVDASAPADTGTDGSAPADAGRDAGVPIDACMAVAETCDEADQDCDGMVDEDFDLMTDEMNCGTCGNVCAGARRCCDGTCRVMMCP